MDKNITLIAARAIVTNHKKIKKLWDDIDHFQKFGSVPAENQKVLKQNVSDMSIGQIVTACFTLPSYITKAKQKLAKMEEGQKKLQLQLEINIKEQELAEIKALRE